ncbi:GTPase family protein [Actinomadura sp. WMMA1423]|uniref:GTPase family protein n=1 Tax=Actinomadura sp. WMMA1423 TaxID=2591108 RepID=UPI00143DD38B|nr:GTPase [Actinomadura sp. WMMA1423]
MRRKILAELQEELRRKPLTIGVVGVSGVGKSTLVNTMCKTDLPTSPTVACTREFESQDVSITVRGGVVEGYRAKLRVVDAPGLGESVEQDPGYLEMYRRELPKCDVVLWLSAARNRAIALEQQYLAELVGVNDRIVFGLSQVDLVDPLDWNTEVNLPSGEQRKNIQEICRDRSERFSATIGSTVEFVPVSAGRRYNLQPLFSALLERAPDERAWIFSGVKAFTAGDWVPEKYRGKVMRGSGGAGSSSKWASLLKLFQGKW